MIGFFEIACGVFLLGILCYRYATATFDTWKNHGVKGPKPVPIFGNMLDVFLGKTSMNHYVKDAYEKYKKDPFFGIYAGRKPVLILSDADMIKSVLIRDFANFADRGMPVDEERDPLAANLFSVEAKRWRPLRAKLSPVFTTGKLKDMCMLIAECADHLEQYVDTLIKKNEPIGVRELTAKYTTDVIGSCAFGIDMKSLSEEETEFRRMGKLIFNPDSVQGLIFKVGQIDPRLAKLVSYFISDRRTANFFTALVLDTMEYRKKHNTVRNDFINVLMELKDHPENIEIELTDNLLVAQALIFFAAGFETSSTAMTNALYELAINQNIQAKVREEIKEAEKQHKGDLRYENVKELKYLDKVFKETLRKYPPAQTLMRQAQQAYTFEKGNLTVPAKQDIWISVHGIQHDPNIYPNPDVFDPERFTPEAEATRHPMHYLPFGDGPRNCIGSRFAVYQTKIGLLKILRSFKVDPTETTKIPYEVDQKAFIPGPKDGMPLRFSRVIEVHS